MSASSPKGAPPNYGRFIPREELQGFANWQPHAFGAATPGAGPGIDKMRPPADASAALLAARQAGYQDGYRDGLAALESFKQSFAQQMAAQLAPQLHRILLKLDRLKKAGADLTSAFGTLRSFASAFKVQLGDLEFGLAAQPATGDLTIDLTDLFIAIGQAAQKRDVAVVLLIDEIQYLSKADLSALIMALHKISQRQLPLLLFGGGLPQLARLAGDAKSYAERLFDYPSIGPLDTESARLALAAPASRENVKYAPDALDYVFTQTGGYPFFLQVWGSHCWQSAPASPITLKHAQEASKRAIEALDESLFKVRLARLTDRQRGYARAMAELGPAPANSTDVARLLGLSVSQAAPIRDELVKKGMAFSPERGLIAFTVPKFDEFMHRAMPQAPNPPGKAKKPAQ